MTQSLPIGATGHPLRHIAVIMDGNNRWASQRGLSGLAGHQAGAERVRDLLDACREYGVQVVTLFAFSSENWQRPAGEVRGLMSLFASYLKKEVKTLKERGIRLRVIGERSRFSPRLCKLIDAAEQSTRDGRYTLALAVDYGGRWDITRAARRLAARVEAGEIAVEDITEEAMNSEISLGDLPPPDLCIRTAGEQRISNFLLWQLAYTEFYFPKCYWPDFDRKAFDAAIVEYNRRQRRFGRTSGQLALAEKASA